MPQIRYLSTCQAVVWAHTRRHHTRAQASGSIPRASPAAPGASAAAAPGGRSQRGALDLDLDETVEYYLEAEDPEVTSNAVILVDAQTQVSRPPSRPGSARASPRPVIGLRISGVVEALITAAAPLQTSSGLWAVDPVGPEPLFSDPSLDVLCPFYGFF